MFGTFAGWTDTEIRIWALFGVALGFFFGMWFQRLLWTNRRVREMRDASSS